MGRYLVICAFAVLAGCQTTGAPVKDAAAGSANGPMRPSGTAFDSVAAPVGDFDTCVGIGIIVPGSLPVQCVHDGVTYTGTAG